ncbi:MAG: TrmH family RNA methyltransferase, partial [Flavobacteriales bacterium]
MGSIFRVRVMYSEVSEILDMLRKSQFGIAGAVMNGESLYESAFAQRTALIIGSESHGLRPEMIQALESRITIPRYGKAESLNASVACAILLAEWKRSAQ